MLDIYEEWLDESIEILKNIKEKLIINSVSDVIEEEWSNKNFFIKEMIYSVMDIEVPVNKHHTEEYKIEIEELRQKWLERINRN